MYSRVSDVYHPRSLRVPKQDPHVRPILEAAVRRRHETTIVGEVHWEDDPTKIFPYVHRGSRADETREVLLATRASRSRFSGKKLIALKNT